jgi:F0F1-type ATP synthase membrane subunit b/b'
MVLLAFAESSIQLFPDATILLHIAMILLMIYVLNRTFFRPINAVLESREKQKGGRGGEAAEILDDVAKKQKEYEAAMLAARNESYELIDKERSAAVDGYQKTVADAKAEAAKRLADEKESIRNQVHEAKVAIALEANKTADKIAANILNVEYVAHIFRVFLISYRSHCAVDWRRCLVFVSRVLGPLSQLPGFRALEVHQSRDLRLPNRLSCPETLD